MAVMEIPDMTVTWVVRNLTASLIVGRVSYSIKQPADELCKTLNRMFPECKYAVEEFFIINH